MIRHRPGIAITAALLLATTRVAADPIPDNVVITSPGAVLDVAMKKFDVPRGTHILSPGAWVKLDTEVRRLQDAEVRLDAENTYMRNRVKGWQPGWKTGLGLLVVGLTSGIWIGHKI